uniref:Head-tail adaptor protein n=1 Tax=Aliivibrio phage vB_Alvi_H905 TaxID=3234039 RepID=A0AB39C9Z6_9VIRU
MRERDPFKRASRRIVRRLGRHHEIKVRPPEGEWLPVNAVFSNPLLDVELSGGGKSGQDLLMQQPHIIVETRYVEGCKQSPNDWSVSVDGREYYVTVSYPKDDGVSYVFLSDQPDNEKQSPEGEGRGRTWR